MTSISIRTWIRSGTLLAALAASPFAQVIFVDATATGAQTGASWADAHVDLKTALAAATSGDELWVADGTYRPDVFGGDREESFVLPSGVSVYGGFAGDEATLEERAGLFASTILSGDLNGDDLPGFVNTNDNSYHVVWVAEGTIDALLDGFTVSGGSAGGGGPINPNGGGLAIHGNVVVRNTTISGNRSQKQGAGFLVSSGGTALFEDCELSGNHADTDGGGGSQVSGDVTCVRTTFRDNSCGDEGGALYFASSVTLIDCYLEGNHADDSGGAVYSFDGVFNAQGCRFVNNSATIDGGGIYNDRGVGTLWSCVISACSATLGGGILSADPADAPSAGGAVLRVENCTLFANTSTSALGGAGVYSTQVGFRLQNTILWENQGAAGTDFAAQYAGPALLADFTCIQSMTPGQAAVLGTGNFSEAPLFVDPDGDDDLSGTSDDNLRLSHGSPCIDAGDNGATTAADKDVAGLPRLVDDPETVDTGVGGAPTVDLGAYEYHSLFGTADEHSVSAGGSHFLISQLGAQFAGDFYIVLGTVSGTTPGLTLAGHRLPLNPDPYFFVTLNNPNQPPLLSSFGTLGPKGGGAATFTLPAGMDASLVGAMVHHALAALDPSTFLPTLTSTPFPLKLVL